MKIWDSVYTYILLNMLNKVFLRSKGNNLLKIVFHKLRHKLCFWNLLVRDLEVHHYNTGQSFHLLHATAARSCCGTRSSWTWTLETSGTHEPQTPWSSRCGTENKKLEKLIFSRNMCYTVKNYIVKILNLLYHSFWNGSHAISL